MTNLNATNKRSISYGNLDRSSCRYCWHCCFYNGSQTGICYLAPGGCFIGIAEKPSDTRLTLVGGSAGNQEGGVWVVKGWILHGKLLCINPLSGSEYGIAEATITFTGSGVPPDQPGWQTQGVETKSDGAYYTIMDVPQKPGTYNVQAHFSGVTMPRPGHSDIVWKLIGSDSNIKTVRK